MCPRSPISHGGQTETRKPVTSEVIAATRRLARTAVKNATISASQANLASPSVLASSAVTSVTPSTMTGYRRRMTSESAPTARSR